MDEQREWIRSRRKKRLRFTAVMLAFCLLVTNYPNILATLSASATEQEDSTVHVSGFGELPEAVRAQNVPVGTEQGELSLPDTLEAFAATESTNPPEDTDPPENPEEEEEQPEKPEGEEEKQPEGEDEGQAEKPEGEDEEQPENPEEGTNPPEDGTEEPDGEDVEQPVEEEKDDIAEPDEEPEALSVQSGVFVMPVYMAEPEVTAETQTLERKEETVMIKGVTWQCEPAYDGNVEGTYIFTAVLPEGYALAEGVNLPQITVTVQDDTVVQALIERIAALPDVQEYMEEEPDIDDWEGDEDAYEEAYEEWMEGLLAYVEEANDIWEAYEALTKEQQAQIPEELLAKLTAWVEIAEQVAGSRKVMAAATHTCDGGTFQSWTNTTSLPDSGDYYLTADVNLGTSSSNACKISGTLKLCLNGYTISGNVPEGMIRVDGGKLLIYDCSKSKSGKIECPQNTKGQNPLLVKNEGVLDLYGGTVESADASAILIGRSGSGGDSIGGTVNVHSGATIIGGTNGILANDMSDGISYVNIHGGSITGKGSGYPIKMQDQDGSVTISGSAAMIPPSSKASIYTVTPVVANAQVSSTYTIDYVDVTEGDTVVIGSTDTVHYKLPDSSSYVLVPYWGDLIAAESTYEVVLNGNGGSGGTGLTSYATGQGAELPTDWKKTNYVFEGWYENADLSGTKVERISKTDFGDKTYYAKWAPVSYTITYDLDGGAVTGNPASYTIESSAITLKNPTKTGYIFAGWSGTGLTGTGNTSVTIAKGSTGDRSYTANWTAKTYTITYSGLDDATLSTKPTQHTYGTDTKIGTPTKTGYTFAGWKINNGTATKTTTLGATAYTTDITLEATWTATGYTISYTLNGGSVSGNPTSYTIESSAITLKNPAKTGYTFAGWSGTGLTGTGNTSVTIAKGSTGDRSYTANWTANTYTITYSGLTGASLTTKPTKHTYGTATTVGTPTKTGYTFEGWKINGTAATKTTTLDATAYTTDITLEATWTATGYTISYTLNGGSVSGNPASYTIESSAITLKNPTKTGYTFAGWSGTGLTSNSTSVTIAKGSTGNRSYTANWTAKTYTITYKDENGTTFSGTHGSSHPIQHTYGTKTTLVSPTKTGYGFSGWYTDINCTGSPVTSLGANLYTADITLYAKWTANTYTITYKGMSDASLTPQPTQHTYGTDTQIGNPTRPGYTFAGWKVNSGSTVTTNLTLGATAYTAAITLTATWTADTYKISYSGLEGATLSPKPTQHTCGKPTTVGNPTKPGYTFVGWKVNSDSTVTTNLTLGATAYTADITLTATWAAATVTINTTKCTHDGAPKVADSGDYVVTFVSESGYSIPAKVTVQIGGTTLASDEYTYDHTTGALTIPRDKITGNIIITAKAVKNPVISGPGQDEPDNTAPAGESDEDGSTVTYTGTYGEEYKPVIIVGGQEVTPEISWDEGKGKGEWIYRSDPDDEITVDFRKRAITGITVTPGTLTIYANDTANESIDALTSYLKEHSSAQASYDNKSKSVVQADYTTTDSFAVKGKAYNYTVSADGKTKGITLTVAPVTAAVTAPDALKQRQKAGGYTATEVKGWLPATVTVTYAGGTTKPESRPVTWNTDSLSANFGTSVGDKETIDGTVALPAWATGDNTVGIDIIFVDKTELADKQMTLTISGGAYGTMKTPDPKGSVTVKDTDAAYSYRYSADNGRSWGPADALPKSGSGYIIPGTYTVEMTYTGKDYTGVKTASFTVVQKPLTVGKGSLAVENRNYDGTTNATLKEGGKPELSGVIEKDDVALGGTLSAVFTNKGPKKNISVTVTGFELTGSDAKYYLLINTTLTLKATINNADGSSPSGGSGGNGGGNGESGGNGDSSGESGESSGDNGGDNSGDNSGDNGNGGTAEGTGGGNGNDKIAGGDNGSTGSSSTGGTGKDGTGSGSTGETDKGGSGSGSIGETGKGSTGNGNGAGSADASGQDGTMQAGSGQQTENVTVQIVQAAAEDGRIVLSGETAASAATGNLTEGSPVSTRLLVGVGTVIVTVVCADGNYSAGTNDVAAVANAVLTPEQIQLVDNGETIEIRVDIKDISNSMPPQDMETVKKGCEAYGKYLPDLKLGGYLDISVYIKTGNSGWNAVAETREPIEIVIGIPEKLRGDGREYYVIRAHEGRHDLLNDMDEVQDTITIITDMFSSYVIAYRLTGAGNTVYGGTDMVYGGVDIVDGKAQCRLCHICPTFRGVCCFIWLVVIVAVGTLAAIILSLGYVCFAYQRERRQRRKKFS